MGDGEKREAEQNTLIARALESQAGDNATEISPNQVNTQSTFECFALESCPESDYATWLRSLDSALTDLDLARGAKIKFKPPPAGLTLSFALVYM